MCKERERVASISSGSPFNLAPTPSPSIGPPLHGEVTEIKMNMYVTPRVAEGKDDDGGG